MEGPEKAAGSKSLGEGVANWVATAATAGVWRGTGEALLFKEKGDAEGQEREKDEAGDEEEEEE